MRRLCHRDAATSGGHAKAATELDRREALSHSATATASLAAKSVNAPLAENAKLLPNAWASIQAGRTDTGPTPTGLARAVSPVTSVDGRSGDMTRRRGSPIILLPRLARCRRLPAVDRGEAERSMRCTGCLVLLARAWEKRKPDSISAHSTYNQNIRWASVEVLPGPQQRSPPRRRRPAVTTTHLLASYSNASDL